MSKISPTPIGPTLFEIELQEACKHIAAYKEAAAEWFGIEPKNVLKSYIIDVRELLEAIRVPVDIEPESQYIRVYLGKVPGDEATDMKLFLTPCNGTSDAIPFREVDGIKHEYVYDFNHPCPNTCDEVSPLFKAGENV